MQTSAIVSCLLGGAAVVLFGCSRGADAPPSPSPVLDAGAGSAARVPEALPAPPASAQGAFSFPSTPLAAEKGQFALVPFRSAIDLALGSGTQAASFVYAGAYLVRAGDRTSEVRWLTEQRGAVPNAFIVPIRRGERARRGDVVLTNFASGSGLQRAIVVSEGETASPRVRYLDLALENPTGWGTEEDTLPPDTFHVLRTPGEVGSTLACREGSRVERVIVTASAGERRLGLGFAGALRDFDVGTCRTLPLVPAVRPGDSVHVPWINGFVAGAKVMRVDAAAGRVAVRFDFAGEEREIQVGFANVAVQLP